MIATLPFYYVSAVEYFTAGKARKAPISTRENGQKIARKSNNNVMIGSMHASADGNSNQKLDRFCLDGKLQ